MKEEILDLIEFTEAIEYIKETEQPTKDETDELIRLIVIVAKIESLTPGDSAQRIARSIRDGAGIEPWIHYLKEKEKIQKEKEPQEKQKPKSDPQERALIYVAHPFTGDEKKNIEKATRIITRLQIRNPTITFVSPLLTFGYLDGKIDYQTAMDLCFSLLAKSDLLLLTGSWWNSKGCQMEREMALRKGIEVVDGTKPGPIKLSSQRGDNREIDFF